MIYSKEQIDQIAEYASYLTTISDISILMNIDADELRTDIMDKSSDVSKAYYKAKTITSMNLRKQEIDLAKVGSPLAVQLTNGYIINMDSDEDL